MFMFRLFILVAVLLFIIFILSKLTKIDWSSKTSYYKIFGFVFIVYSIGSAVLKSF
jgi:hypothetical protein